MIAIKSVFISFDYDHDKDLRGNLVAQAEDPKSPFRIKDESVRNSIDEKWRKEVRDRICRVDLVFVICGEHTHDAEGVAAEVGIAREVGTPYFLLQGRRTRTCKKPKNVLASDEMHTWTWENLRKLIASV